MADFAFQDTAPAPTGFDDRLAGLGGGADDITSSFAVLKLRGKIWALRTKGDEYKFRAGKALAPTIKVMILDAAPKHRMLFKPYVSGTNEKPLCWSDDMIAASPAVPFDQVPKLENGQPTPSCAMCPMNMVGSASSSSGKGRKACSERKRFAMLIHPDSMRSLGIQVDDAVKLDLPSGSFVNFKNYSEWLWNNKKARPIQVWTELSFSEAEYPQVNFQPVGWVDADTLNGAFQVLEGTTARTILAPPQVRQIAAPRAPQFGAALDDGGPAPLPARALPAPAMEITPPAHVPAQAPAPVKKAGPAIAAQPQTTEELLRGLNPEMLAHLKKLSGI